MAPEAAEKPTGWIKLSPPPEFDSIVDWALRVKKFADEHVLNLSPRDPKECWHAGQAILHFMRQQLIASTLCAETNPFMPMPIAILARPIYEAMLQLHYLLRPDDTEERKNRGRMFCYFEALETVEGIRTGGYEAKYKESLSEQERSNYERRIEITEQAKAEFSPEQQRQMKRGLWNVTWTGRTIAQLAKEFEEERGHRCHVAWYGVMSKLTHVSPGTIHWVYAVQDPHGPAREFQEAEMADRDRSQSADWLRRSAGTMYLSCLRFLQAFGIDKPKEADELTATLMATGEQPARISDAKRVINLVHRLLSVAQPRRIILFGSAGLGDIRRAENDFDLLVVLPDGTDVGRVRDEMFAALWEFGIPTDLIAVTESDLERQRGVKSSVVYAALNEGTEIYRAA